MDFPNAQNNGAGAIPVWGVSGPGGVVTVTDKSGSITAGGSAQELMAANPARTGWRIQNTSDTVLWFNDTGAVAIAGSPSYSIQPGGIYEPQRASQAAISIIGATTGKTFSATEFS